MRQHPFLEIFGRLRQHRIRRLPGDCTTGRPYPVVSPLLDYLLGADSMMTEPSTADILARLMPDSIGRKPSRISPSDPSGVSPSPASGRPAFSSKMDARRLRVVDRAIAEIVKYRRLW